MSLKTRQLYEFGGYRLEREERLLRRDDDVISLPPKAIELLIVLLESGGRILTKDELMATVWADSFVEEANLAQNIFLLRKALGESRGNATKFIDTIPRRGYRFVGRVSSGGGETDTVTTIEQSITNIVIEEEIDLDDETGFDLMTGGDETANVRSLSKARAAKRSRVAVVALASIALAFSSGFIYLRSNSRAAFTAMKVSPVTTYADNEYEPALSPDGQLLAFSWTGGETDPAKKDYNIYVKQTGASGETLQITHNTGRSSFPSFSPDGRFIAYTLTQKELLIVPALGGPGRKLHEGLDLGMPRWTVDGKRIIFPDRPDWQTPRSIYSIDVDGLQVAQLTSPVAGTGDNCPAISPDGLRIAFTREEGSMSELLVADLTSGEPRQITFDNRKVLGVTWTADGSEIVFASNRGSGSFRLWRISSDGGEPAAIDGVGNGDFLPTISSRGDMLAFHRQFIDTNIWRVSTGGNGRKPAPADTVRILNSSQRDEFPAVSPDGGKIAFTSTRSGSFEIWLANADGTASRQLTNFAGGFVSHPAWSPDGKSIAFDASPSSRSMVFVAAVESGVVTPVTDQVGNSVVPSWSQDGTTIYFGSDRAAGWQIWKTSANGGQATQITTDGGYEAHESLDGKHLYYNKGGYMTAGIFRQSLEGGGETKVFDLVQLWSVGDWAITDKGLYFIHRYDEQKKPVSRPTISFFEFDTAKTAEIAPLPRDPRVDPGLSVSPDGKYLFYSIDDTHTSDIMLIENFH